MTSKRYRKLGYALMQKIHQKDITVCGTSATPGWGKVLKGIKKAKPLNGVPYAQAWESIKDIRAQYGM